MRTGSSEDKDAPRTPANGRKRGEVSPPLPTGYRIPPGTAWGRRWGIPRGIHLEEGEMPSSGPALV